MYSKIIGGLWHGSVILAAVLLCGKLIGKFDISWFVVPFAPMLVLSVNQIISLSSYWYVAKVSMKRREGGDE